ncbi:hypothetical protein SAMN04487894_102333 [Niabella drilacis]|uniref:Uncharacterized protein n=1 Tax=Niabella drilacis (strain DSM 25811 / CCM 8410 / CCUG 62505 / LMG 26954 / E90) TaxID=1285928 RepID=A0A1G6LHJ2_NIADE|nr:hypothetical protein SAMN04487894_102333 [Niabella drilacis]
MQQLVLIKNLFVPQPFWYLFFSSYNFPNGYFANIHTFLPTKSPSPAVCTNIFLSSSAFLRKTVREVLLCKCSGWWCICMHCWDRETRETCGRCYGPRRWHSRSRVFFGFRNKFRHGNDLPADGPGTGRVGIALVEQGGLGAGV